MSVLQKHYLFNNYKVTLQDMSETITWAVLSDGRFIKIMVHNGTGPKLSVLDADKNKDLAEICYQVVNCKRMLTGKETAKSEKLDFIQLQADFLSAQYEQSLFDALVIAAPPAVIKPLRDALPEQLNQLIVGELQEDILMKSNDILDEVLVKLIDQGKQ